MIKLFFAIYAVALSACSSDRYNDDKRGSYGNGPTVSQCDDPAICQKTAATTANNIRQSDPNFESKYLVNMRLEEAISDLITHGFLKKRRVRILKAHVVDQVMRAYISAQDDNGQPITDLTSLGLTISDGSKDLAFEIGQVIPASALSVSMVMDYSGSMGAALPKLEQANIQFYHALPAAQFAVVKFSDQAQIIAPMAHYEQKSELDSIFTKNFPSGSTALFDGILKGLETHQTATAESQTSRDTLNLGVVFTDGLENASHANYDSVKLTLRNSKIPQIILGMGHVDIKSLLTFAEDTNGLFQFVANSDGIEAAMSRVTNIVSSIVPIDIPLSPELSGLKADQLVAKIKEKE